MKILIIRFSSIGDIVLTSPVIRSLKQQLANSEIHFLTKAMCQEILTANPYLSKVFAIKNKVDEVLNSLKEEKYENYPRSDGLVLIVKLNFSRNLKGEKIMLFR